MHAFLANYARDISHSLLQANCHGSGIVAIARNHQRTVNVYSFLSVGPTYRDMDKVVACRTIFISNLSLL